MRQRPSRLITLIFLSLMFIGQPSWAGRVVKVKGKKVYIKLSSQEAENVMKGDKLYVTTKSGKKKGLVIIRKMKGKKVIAQLKKGKARKGMKTKLRKTKKKKKMEEVGYEDASEVAQTETEPSSGRPDMQYGFMGGFGSATQEVEGIANMSGSTMSFKGIFDYSLFDDLGVRARAGMEMFSVTGTNGATEYKTDLNYLTIDLLVRYYILNSSSFGLFANAGMGIYTPLSSDLGPAGAQAIKEDSISTTSLLIFGFGVSLPMGSWEIFAGADYFYYPPSDNVTTSAFGGKLGLLFEL